MLPFTLCDLPKLSRRTLMAGVTTLGIGLGLGAILAPQNTYAQGSLSGAESSRAENLLDLNTEEPYLQSEYYQKLISEDDIYGRLPEDLRRIFARIRFIALSIDDNAASDQVLNALTRAYLIYGMEAAAVNEAIKIILPEWRARSLVDISDYYDHIGQIQQRDDRLQEALNLLSTTDGLDAISARQYYFDIASRMALAGKDDISKSIINTTFADPIHRITGFLQIADRVHIGSPSNALFEKQTQDILSVIRQCKPEKLFVTPGEERSTTFSLNIEDESQHYSDQARDYVLESYSAFEHLYRDSQNMTAELLDNVHLRILMNLNQALFTHGYKKRAHRVLNTIAARFLNIAKTQVAQTSTPTHAILSQETLDQLRNELIGAFIRTDEVESGMALTRDLTDPVMVSEAYISAGDAHNDMENFNAATALFNYAQDVSDLIKDPIARDAILDEVIRGQAKARLYGSAFRNISLIISQDVRARAFFTMARQMIANNDLASAVQLAEYVQPHDLRIQLYANLAYVRTLKNDLEFSTTQLKMPPAQELFQHIYDLMELRMVGGVEENLNEQHKAVLMAMCANMMRKDIPNSAQSDNPLDDIKHEEYRKKMRASAIDYTANIDNVILRANSFSNIAQMILEQDNVEEAQLFLDTAWNLAWSIRGSSPTETDKIFLRIVRGKILSEQVTDAFNIATGMSAHLDQSSQLFQNEVTGEISYSDRIQALMDFSRMAMSLGEYSISLRAIEDIGIETAKSVAMTNAIRDLIEVENSSSIDGALQTN